MQNQNKHHVTILVLATIYITVYTTYRVAPEKLSYRTLSISSLNIDQFSQFFSPVDSVRNLLLIDMHTPPTMSLHYLVKHKYLKNQQYHTATVCYCWFSDIYVLQGSVATQ